MEEIINIAIETLENVRNMSLLLKDAESKDEFMQILEEMQKELDDGLKIIDFWIVLVILV